jgi:hypothetical protein
MAVKSFNLEEKHEEMLSKLCKHEHRNGSNMIQTLIQRAYQNVKGYLNVDK